MVNRKIIFIVGTFLFVVLLIFSISEITNNVLCKPRLAGHTFYICRPSLYERIFVKEEPIEVYDTVTIYAKDKTQPKKERGR